MTFKIGDTVSILPATYWAQKLLELAGVVGRVIDIEKSCVIVKFDKDVSEYYQVGLSKPDRYGPNCGRFSFDYLQACVVKSGKVLSILTNNLVKLNDGSICKLTNHNLKIGTAIKVTGTKYQIIDSN